MKSGIWKRDWLLGLAARRATRRCTLRAARAGLRSEPLGRRRYEHHFASLAPVIAARSLVRIGTDAMAQLMLKIAVLLGALHATLAAPSILEMDIKL